MLDDALHLADASVCDRAGVQPALELVRRHRSDDRVDLRLECGTVLDAANARVEARIIREIEALEDAGTEIAPFALVLDADQHRVAVGGVNGAVRRDRRVARAAAPWGASTVRRRIDGMAHPLREGLEKRNFDARAASRAIAHQQRRLDAGESVHAGSDVGHRNAGARQFAFRAGDGDETTLRLHEEVVRFFITVRPIAAVTRNAADDQPWITRAQLRDAETKTVDGARSQVLNEDVGALQQRGEDLLRRRLLEIERERLFRPVQPNEVRRLTMHGAVVVSREVAVAGALDLDDASAQIGQLSRCEWGRHRLLERDDGNVDERQHQSGRLLVFHLAGTLENSPRRRYDGWIDHDPVDGGNAAVTNGRDDLACPFKLVRTGREGRDDRLDLRRVNRQLSVKPHLQRSARVGGDQLRVAQLQRHAVERAHAGGASRQH